MGGIMKKLFSSRIALTVMAFLLGSGITFFTQDYYRKQTQEFTDQVSISASAADKMFQRKKRRAENALINLRNKMAIDPQAKIKTLARKMDKMFHHKFPSFNANAPNGIEITEREDAKFKYLDISGKGYSKDNVNIQIGNGMVTLSGEKVSDEKTQVSSFQSVSKFRKSFNVPYGVNADRAEIEAINGRLTIKFPKRS
jgi:HSP20 family molecular chaperone IbpA